MKVFFAFLLVILLSFSGYHLSFRHYQLPLFARKFYLTGTEFLFLGLLLGPEFLDIMDRNTVSALEPIATVLLGMIGFIFGLQLEIKKLKLYPVEYLLGSLLESLITFVTVLVGIFFVLYRFPQFKEYMPPVSCLIVATVAVGTAPGGLLLMAEWLLLRRRNTVTLLQYISSINSLASLLFCGLVYLFYPIVAQTPHPILNYGWWLLILPATAAGLVLLFSFYLSLRRERSELIAITIGMVLLAGGCALVLHFSPLLFNFFLGVCIANLSVEKTRLFALIAGIQKPLYLLLLLFLGVGWSVTSAGVFYLAAAYCALRFIGKLTGGFFLAHIGRIATESSAALGFGLMGFGGLSLAILFDFVKSFPAASINAVSIALLAMVAYDILSPYLLGRFLEEVKKDAHG